MTLQKQLDHIQECVQNVVQALTRCDNPADQAALTTDYWRLMDEEQAILYDMSAQAAQTAQKPKGEI